MRKESIVYILKELAKGNTIFGNRILQDFKESFDTLPAPFPVSSSTIYESLYSLEELGYVESRWSGDEFLNKRNKKIYSITDRGILHLKSTINEAIRNIDDSKASLDKLKEMLIK